jgi:hypothetical protein
MNKLSTAAIVVAIGSGGFAASAAAQRPGASAAAQRPGNTQARTTANAALAAAASALVADGTAGLVARGGLTFRFAVPVLICPPGSTNLAYCVAAGGGSIFITAQLRLILRVKEIRPRHPGRGHFTVIASILARVTAGQTFSTSTCGPSSASTRGCPLKITAKGLAILTYANAHHVKLPTQLVARVRPTGGAISTEVLHVLNL